MAYSTLSTNPETQRAWQERTRLKAIAKAKENPKPGTPLKSGGTLNRTGTLRKQSPQAKSDARELAKIKVEMLAEDAACRRCATRPATDLHHKAGRVGYLVTFKPLLVLLCRVCHSMCKDEPKRMMAEGWIVSRFKQREEL